MQFFACILTKYPFISQVNQILPQRSIEVTGGQNLIFLCHQNVLPLFILFFVDVIPMRPSMKPKQLLRKFSELSFKKKIEFLRLFLRELQEVKLRGQQRSNRGQSAHYWKKTTRDSIVGVHTNYFVTTTVAVTGKNR